MALENIVLAAGGTLAGLFAGLLYAFSIGVIPALHALSGNMHIAAMQAINEKIENPFLFVCFFGPTVLLPLAAYLHRDRSVFLLLVLASLLYIVGANGITAFGNIPLNRKLASINVASLSSEAADKIRTEFQGAGQPWMRLHHVRTLAAIVTTVLVFITCLLK